MTHKHVLIIDDDPEMLRLLETGFTRVGYDVSTAKDGLRGMQLFLSQAPNVVVTDILMPTQEGIETIIGMKRARPEVRIVAMSGGGRMRGEEVLKIAGHLGADRVITKPFRLAEIIGLVDALIDPAPA
jgi:DNA-binding response OmpR family regulator